MIVWPATKQLLRQRQMATKLVPYSSWQKQVHPHMTISIRPTSKATNRHCSWMPTATATFCNQQSFSFPQYYQCCAFSSTTSKNHSGEAIYQQALQALQKVEELQKEREAQKSQELHSAIEKAEAKQKAHQDNPKAANLRGVTVVKTVVQQTKRDVRGKQSRDEEALEWNQRAHTLLQQAAEQYGHSEAFVLLGNDALQQAKHAWQSMGDQADENTLQQQQQLPVQRLVHQSLDYYKKSDAAAGWFNVGQLLWTGFPVQDEASLSKDAPHSEGGIILPPNREASMEAFRKAIHLGDPDAMYFVGVHLLGQEDDDDDNTTLPTTTTTIINALKEGLDLVTQSAKLGHGPARYYLALFHLNGHATLNIEPCSSEEFVSYLNDACDAEDPDALFLRGHAYHDGDHGYPQDYKLALQDFIAAAQAGNADAAVSAGAMYYNGMGIPQDPKRAFELYQRAGEMGSTEGWRNVAACYAQGVGIPQSMPTAKYIINTMLKEQDK